MIGLNSKGNRRGMQPKPSLDLTGQRLNKLIALRPIGVTSSRNVIWECKCDCGNIPTEEEDAFNRCSCCGKRLDP